MHPGVGVVLIILAAYTLFGKRSGFASDYVHDFGDFRVLVSAETPDVFNQFAGSLAQLAYSFNFKDHGERSSMTGVESIREVAYGLGHYIKPGDTDLTIWRLNAAPPGAETGMVVAFLMTWGRSSYDDACARAYNAGMPQIAPSYAATLSTWNGWDRY